MTDDASATTGTPRGTETEAAGVAALVGAAGGAGTTRLTVETGALLARGGERVAVFDAAFDTQGMVDHVEGRPTRWSSSRPPARGCSTSPRRGRRSPASPAERTPTPPGDSSRRCGRPPTASTACSSTRRRWARTRPSPPSRPPTARGWEAAFDVVVPGHARTAPSVVPVVDEANGAFAEAIAAVARAVVGVDPDVELDAGGYLSRLQ
ncbi:hypothetical protein BRD18_07905 [Halobacteriales archaeon SW_7_71_33]|nr:MAG: hypothetical protein BRD18_07905 [Halobacteriales archaeon SW_7_71_33]